MSQTEGKNGFTLIESILAILVISAIALSMSYIIMVGMRSYAMISDRRTALQNARLGVNMMANEIETIANPATDISSVSSTSMTFTNAQSQSVTYSISGGNLMRNSDVLAANVTGTTAFSYFNAAGGSTSTPSLVARVHIIVQVNTPGSTSGQVTILNDAYLRNRYYTQFTRN